MHIVVQLLIVAWVAASLAATQARSQLWLNEPGLWADAVRHGPDKPRPWVNLGKQYALDGASALAEDAYARAMSASLRPGRSRDEQIFSYGLAAANLAILRCTADKDVDAALAIVAPLMSATINPTRAIPIPTAVREVQTWLKQRKAAGGCGVPASLS